MANYFWQKEKRMKRYRTLLFSVKEQGLETRKLRKLLAKEEEEEEVQKDVQKLCKKLFKCKSRSCFYRLFMSGQENHWKSYNLEKILRKPLEELHLLIFIQNLSLVIDYQNHVIDYTKHFMKRCDSSQLNLNFNVQIHW